jgi:hypothetical protein
MELIIDLPVRFRRFEPEDFIALFPNVYDRDAIALVLRLSIASSLFSSKATSTAHRAMITGLTAGIDGALLFILKKLD